MCQFTGHLSAAIKSHKCLFLLFISSAAHVSSVYWTKNFAIFVNFYARAVMLKQIQHVLLVARKA